MIFMALTIRKAEKADLDDIMRMEKDCFTAEAWSRESFEYFLSGLDRFVTLIAESDGKVCGYMCGSCVAGEGEIHSIAVDKNFRRMGIGRALIEEFEKFTRPEVEFLEVRVSNRPARSLYKSLGFKEIALRRGYYDAPPEDAIVMQKN